MIGYIEVYKFMFGWVSVLSYQVIYWIGLFTVLKWFWIHSLKILFNSIHNEFKKLQNERRNNIEW